MGFSILYLSVKWEFLIVLCLRSFLVPIICRPLVIHVSAVGRRIFLQIWWLGMFFVALTLLCPQTKRTSNNDFRHSHWVPTKPKNHLVRWGQLCFFVLPKTGHSWDISCHLDSEKNKLFSMLWIPHFFWSAALPSNNLYDTFAWIRDRLPLFCRQM